jgi:nucleotide-binding universal stress UspA family protein
VLDTPTAITKGYEMRVTFQRILCATDLSDASHQAIAHGITLAREFEAHLLVCHCIHLPVPSIYGEAYLAPEEQLHRNIDFAKQRIAELMGDHAVDWEPLIIVGPAAEEITRVAREEMIDITLTATQGRRMLRRMLLGSVTERLMRTLPCPLLVIPAPEGSAAKAVPEAARPFERILVGCDFSPDADLAFQHGLSMAQEFQAELHLMHVIETPHYTETLKPVFAHRPASTAVIRDFLQSKIEALVPEDARHWCQPVTVLEEGQPYAQLLRYAEEHRIDLIVLGLRGQGLIGTMFVGSTTDRVIRRSTCPVLSVCPHSHNA